VPASTSSSRSGCGSSPAWRPVAIASKVPTAESPRRDGFSIEGAPPNAAQPYVAYASVSGDYFRTLRIALRQGRTFDASDRAGTPATAVIGEGLARFRSC